MNTTSHPQQQRHPLPQSRVDRPKSSPTEQSDERNVSGLVLDARCAMAMARITGSFDVRVAFDHCRLARRCAFRAGEASLSGTDLPRMFDGSPTLIGAWLSGQNKRQFVRPRLSLVHA